MEVIPGIGTLSLGAPAFFIRFSDFSYFHLQMETLPALEEEGAVSVSMTKGRADEILGCSWQALLVHLEEEVRAQRSWWGHVCPASWLMMGSVEFLFLVLILITQMVM